MSYKSPKQPSRDVLRKNVFKICSKFTGEHPRRSCNFNKVSKQSCLNRTLAWVFSCKFSVYFQNTFSKSTSRQLLLKRHFLSGGMCHLCFPNRAGSSKWAGEGPTCDIEYAFRNIRNY